MKVALAALVWSAATPPQGIAARRSQDEAVVGASADIERLVGNAVEIHAAPGMAGDPAMPAICKTLADGFREAASTPDLRAHMEHIVHEIVIERWTVREAPRWVTMNKGVMTVQTLTDPTGIEHLRPLIVQVLKEKVQLMEKYSR
ncbi:MAG TPA: hypothetical protein VK961_04865 [Chthoniobacter sp.]|nr:hypothetical protein [Chthoniobacter sp.]